MAESLLQGDVVVEEEPLEENMVQHDSPPDLLRVLILGAIDGLISVSAIMMGIGGAGIHSDMLVLAGIAALVGGALSMAVGEFISNHHRPKYSTNTNSFASALGCALSFLIGGFLSILVVCFVTSERIRLHCIALSSSLSSMVLGSLSSALHREEWSHVLLSGLRVMCGSLVAMGITYAVGHLLMESGV